MPRPEWIPATYSDAAGVTVWYYARPRYPLESRDVLGTVHTCTAATPRRWSGFGRGDVGEGTLREVAAACGRDPTTEQVTNDNRRSPFAHVPYLDGWRDAMARVRSAAGAPTTSTDKENLSWDERERVIQAVFCLLGHHLPRKPEL